MKTILLGNAGAGKSTLAGQLIAHQPAARLSLDTVAFAGGSERLPLAESVEAVRGFIAAHDNWILEGCYADILEPVLPFAETLIFLNPGVEVCQQHCRARPWEPEKFGSSEEQDANLAALLAWVGTYDCRGDAYGLQSHRRLFEMFAGTKWEFTHPSQYSRALTP